MKKRLAIILALVLALSMVLVACNKDDGKTGTTDGNTNESGTDNSNNNASGDKMKVEIVAKGFQHQFWKAVEQGAKQAGEELNADIHFVGPNTESDIADQVQMFNNAISAQPNAICLAALDTESVKEGLNQTVEKKIPVIGFDSGVPGAPEGSIAATASTNNKAAGALAAESLYEYIKDEIGSAEGTVRIGVLSQETNSESIVGRTTGFIEKMKELVGDGVALVGNEFYAKDGGDEATAKVLIDIRVPATVDDAQADAEAVALLNEDDIIAIYGSNEFSAKAIIRAGDTVGGKLGNRAEDNTKVWAVGFDAGKFQKDAVKDGRLVGAITQDPVQIGYKAVELAIKAAKGEAVEDVDTGAKWYNAENMETEEFQPLLYD